MKLKSLTVATLTALYAAGIGAATINKTAQASSGWKPIDLTAEEIKQREEIRDNRKAQFDALSPRNNPGALNRQLHRKSAADKFKAEPNLTGEHVYIIQLKDKPVATYTGGIAGLQATALNSLNAVATKQSAAPQSKGTSVSSKLFTASRVNNSAISAYRHYLGNKQAQFITEANKLGVNLKVEQQFNVTLNAVTAKLSQKQAAQLAESDQVSYIQRSVVHELDSDVGPQNIKADQVWTGTGSHDGMPYKGEGQIIAVIDTGINSDH
ncbi:MAG: protease inhibitor I9 family protein, partial [Kangiellaceae bacterium]|nr:protease inhibitor I9 family protein [Kangiellaceae bacterium]